MDATLRPIQGPQGTGKTYFTARAILSRVRKGYRFGVSSNSHEAIRNVLMACLKAYDEGAPIENLSIAHKVSGGGDGYPADCPGITRTTTNDDPELAPSNVVGGKGFFFADRKSVVVGKSVSVRVDLRGRRIIKKKKKKKR